jgi:hypothetical protein
MRRNKTAAALGLSAFLAAFTAVAQAGTIDTVNWAADSTVDGAGTGTLAGGAITVTYSTIIFGNAGTMIAENWDTSLATSGYAGGGVTNNSGGVLGTTSPLSPYTESIQFSAAVANPVLLVNFGDNTTSFDFGSAPVTLLASHNASLSGDIVTFSGATNSANDGFALQLNGTYGPGSPLNFNYSTTRTGDIKFDSAGFTIAESSPAPEPATMWTLGLGLIAMLLAGRRATGRLS